MQFAIVNSNQVVKIDDTSVLFPNVSFPVSGPNAEFLSENSAMEVVVWEPFDITTEKQNIVEPYIKDGKVYTCVTVKKTEAELAEDAVKAQQVFIDNVVVQVQLKLDNFAKTRNYDNILSACTYATSSVAQFKIEGQRAVELRDATWSALYALLEDVNSGNSPTPSSFDDIETMLPEFIW